MRSAPSSSPSFAAFAGASVLMLSPAPAPSTRCNDTFLPSTFTSSNAPSSLAHGGSLSTIGACGDGDGDGDGDGVTSAAAPGFSSTIVGAPDTTFGGSDGPTGA